VLRRVGLSLSRVPLEHLFSIYEIEWRVAGSCANKVVAGVRCRTLLPNIRPLDTRANPAAASIRFNARSNRIGDYPTNGSLAPTTKSAAPHPCRSVVPASKLAPL
jgi:hypothetical protein